MKLIIFVHTCASYENSRAKIIEQTWAANRDDVVFITDNPSSELKHHIYVGDYQKGYTYHPETVKKMFALFLEKYSDYDFYMIIDDDAYLYIDKLKSYLSFFDKQGPYMIGDFLNWLNVHPFSNKECDYNSWIGGGSGIVFTHSSICKYVDLYNNNPLIPYNNHDVWLHLLFEASNKSIRRIHCPGFHQFGPNPEYMRSGDYFLKNNLIQDNNVISIHLNGRVFLLKDYHNITNTALVSVKNQINKNLVYVSIFYDIKYLELFELFIISAKLFSNINTIDFLVLTNSDFGPKILQLSKSLGIPIQLKYLDCKTPLDGASARLHVFEYENIDKYEKILYLDVDILIQNNLTSLFECEIDDKLYAVAETGYIHDEWFGGWFFDFTTIDKSLHGFNSGALLFKNTPTMKKLFNDIITLISEFKQSTTRGMPRCWEQPFINYKTYHNNLQDITLMNNYINLANFENVPISPKINKKIILNHFIYWANKQYFMRDHMNMLLEYYINTNANANTIINHILDKQYTWNSGTIKFLKDNAVITTWGRGVYKILNTHIVEASWNGYRHIVLFNNSFEGYTSILIGANQIVYGRAI